jgi:hypothetical protein
MRKSRISMLASVLSFCLLTLSGSAALAANLTNHGGPVITSAHAVFIFWGPSFNTGGADHTYATTLQAFRDQLGINAWYNTLTKYCGSNGCIAIPNLGGGTADLFDTSPPPTNVTDSVVRGEVNKYLATHTKDNSAIYMVFIPSTSYSSDGSGATSCGGPNPAYCAYHSWIGSGTSATKYTIQPYPSCALCQVPGWSIVQDQERLVAQEIAETVTDPTGSTWSDSSGNEIASKCTLTFLSGGFAYPYLWSNAAGACVQ